MVNVVKLESESSLPKQPKTTSRTAAADKAARKASPPLDQAVAGVALASPDQDSHDEQDNGLLDHSAHWLHRLGAAVLSKFEGRLSELGVTTAQWKVMIVLHHQEATTPFAVANYINVDGGSVTRVLERLMAKGLVSRARNSDDRRLVELSLTQKGEDLMAEMIAIANAEDDRWLAPLSRGELIAFKELLAKLLNGQGIDIPERWRRSGLCTDPQ